MKFKDGQIVRLVDNHCIRANIGATAKVMGISKLYLNIKWLTDSKGQADGHYYLKSFKPVEQQLLFSFMNEGVL